MNIIEAIQDENLFRPFLDHRQDLSSWRPWMAVLRAIYGLPITGDRSRELIREVTGRDPDKLRRGRGYLRVLLLTGRRSGKSRTAAVIAAFEAVLAGHEEKLSKGEMAVVPIICPTKAQGVIVKNYLRAIFDIPILKSEVLDEQKDGFTLNNRTRIQIMSNDYRSVRGYTVVCTVIDEAAFLGLEGESRMADTETIRAVEPSMASTAGRLVVITSPYARRGWCYDTWRRHFGDDASKTLVVNCPSKVLNPTLDEGIIEDAMREDMAAAKSEYFGEFRDDVQAFLPLEVIERLVVRGRKELLPRKNIQYAAFADVSGGRGDDAALGIAHLNGRGVVVDCIRRYRAPFNPHDVVRQMVAELRRYGVDMLVGDNYAAEWVSSSFQELGINYTKCDMPKSDLYLELLPRLCSGEIELLDDPVTVNQLANLERRTRSGGKDKVDHPNVAGAHDDCANVLAGVSEVAATYAMTVGAL